MSEKVKPKTLIFVKTKRGAEDLEKDMTDFG